MYRRSTAWSATVAVLVLLGSLSHLGAQVIPHLLPSTDEELPVRGFCIAAPRPADLGEFIRFVSEELVPARINTLVLRVEYNFEYRSHPELRDPVFLSRSDVKRLVAACRSGGIKIIPQLNLLGHQSWHGKLGNLLSVYPHLDETPHIELPEVYSWPNPDGLYCKSYCPLHPEVHSIVFALVDELVEAFEADAFHAGMDEVFYIADPKCPRCADRDPAELFAGEVSRARDHLAKTGRKLWIWGDRLIDGETTGIGLWEASLNDTHSALDTIPNNVVICDWHYERAEPTAPYFAAKGFQVVSCPWNRAEVARAQINAMHHHRANSNPTLGHRFRGVMQTIWSEPDDFLEQYYGRAEVDRSNGDPVACAKVFLTEIGKSRE